MEINEFIQLLKRKGQTVLSIFLLFILGTAVLILVQPLKYEAASKILVVQDFNGNVDPYTAAQSNEYLSNILANVITSESFFDEVMNSGFDINQNYFPQRADQKMDAWTKTVSASPINDTGIIDVRVYHPDKYQVEQIAKGVDYILKTRHQEYDGGGDRVNIKIIDEPVVSRWPVKPNLVLNLISASILSLIFSFFYIYLFPDEKYSLKLWGKRKRKKMEAETNIVYSTPRVDSDSAPVYHKDDVREENLPEEIFAPEKDNPLGNIDKSGSIKNILDT